jgi:putative membrane protein
MWVFPLIFFIFVAVLLGALFRGAEWPIRGGRDAQGRAESARDILDRRYARSEINRGEYHQMRKDLE